MSIATSRGDAPLAVTARKSSISPAVPAGLEPDANSSSGTPIGGRSGSRSG
ncbi:hypothetical protein ACVIM9_007488 [Bradyrhizobium sp. USDA 4520]